jgi:hypothetical protein
MLIRIQEPSKHKEHFIHFQKNLFPECDSSGKNVSRFCFESYDPEIFVNKNAKVYTKITVEEQYSYIQNGQKDDDFNKLLKWITNKGGAFVSGQRNDFIFRLAGACCRFGIHEYDCEQRMCREFLTHDSSFTKSEAIRTIKSAYKSNTPGTARFDDNARLVTSKTNVEVDLSEIELSSKARDIIYSDDVKEAALRIKRQGYESAESTGIEGLDFKLKRGDVTLLSGIGNYGKSAFLRYLQLTKTVLDGTKWCAFPPEDFPAEEYYHGLVEMYEGQSLANTKAYYSDAQYTQVYDWIGKHFFFCYPQEVSATPEYILSRFLEMIIKEKVSGLIIDPFNQQFNDYSTTGGRDDKYLERTLMLYDRFAKENHVYVIIVAHPKQVAKMASGNYECPDVFDIAGGAMWNNKMDNILIYHRPVAQTEPMNPLCELHKKKIRRQNVVGKKGSVIMEFDANKRRFIIDGVDYLSNALRAKNEPTNSPALTNAFGGLINEPFS